VGTRKAGQIEVDKVRIVWVLVSVDSMRNSTRKEFEHGLELLKKVSSGKWKMVKK
jgi:hypothetical protein